MESPLRSSRPGHLTVVRPLVWSEIPDEELVSRCLGDEARARRELWDCYQPAVRRLLRRRLSEDVDDQIQETFLRVFRNLGTLRDPQALKGFVLGVAFRVRQTEVRRLMKFRDRFQLAAHSADETEGNMGVPGGERGNLAHKLWSLLEQAGEETRVLFVLRHIEELELPEMAAVMGTSLSTAKRKLSRATARVEATVFRYPEFKHLLAGSLRSSTPLASDPPPPSSEAAPHFREDS